MPLPRALARFNRVVTNRVQGIWAPFLPPWVVVEHRGRRSGRRYRTPVVGARHGDDLRLCVLYGPESDWVRNLLAAGSGTVVRLGRRVPIDVVRLVETDHEDGFGWPGRLADHVLVARLRRSGPRTFDPVVLGETECAAWMAYYRHEWRPLLRYSLGLVSVGFGTGPIRTVHGAWLVLRANQVWAPYPDNDPDRAREYMRRFYAMIARDGGLRLDPVEAARREVEWWRIHRVHQRESGLGEPELAAAVARLYGYVYGVPEADVLDAARLRVLAMRYSDEWVAAGCDLGDPRVALERDALVSSYAALRQAIGASPEM